MPFTGSWWLNNIDIRQVDVHIAHFWAWRGHAPCVLAGLTIARTSTEHALALPIADMLLQHLRGPCFCNQDNLSNHRWCKGFHGSNNKFNRRGTNTGFSDGHSPARTLWPCIWQHHSLFCRVVSAHHSVDGEPWAVRYSKAGVCVRGYRYNDFRNLLTFI